jgi:hypothetical protein
MPCLVIGVATSLSSIGCKVRAPDAPQKGPAALNRALLDVFPSSTVILPAEDQGRTELSSTYTPSGSLWAENLDEAKVFNHEIKHLQGKDNSYVLRLGKGGQLYSLRGAFGESIPPQSVGNPWNDEVWQFVAVCTKYNNTLVKDPSLPEELKEKLTSLPYEQWYFLHNSGTYIPSALDSGVFTVSCDVLSGEEKPGSLDLLLRGTTPDGSRHTFGSVHVRADTVVMNGVKHAIGRPGGWRHIELTFAFGGTATQELRAVFRDGEGNEARMTAPFQDPNVTSLLMINLSPGGGAPGVVNVDNLNVKRVVDGVTEWPLRGDFENFTLLDVSGADPEKGREAMVTDRVAASGAKSLEIRNGKEAGAQGIPRLRFMLGSTIANYLYCPLLAEDTPDDGRSYRSVNWGFVPQQNTIHRSPLLYYVQTRDAGDGIIEVTYVVHNFSVRDDIVFDWLNAPWGGTRMSSLPYHYLSSPEGELQDREWMKVNAGAIGVRSTGGWNLSSAGESPDSPSLALVFGRDKNLEAEKERRAKGQPHIQIDESIYRHMIGQEMPENWRTIPENVWRNYEVAVVIPRFRLAPGTTIWYRSYLVVNRRDRAIELAKSLVDQVDYGLLTFDAATTPTVPVFIENGKVRDSGKTSAFKLFARPVSGTLPLFLIENATTGEDVITTDPYIFVAQEKLDLGLPLDDPKYDYYRSATGYSMAKHNSNWKRLLGFAYTSKPETGSFAPLSGVLGALLFPAANAHHLDVWVEAAGNVGP